MNYWIDEIDDGNCLVGGSAIPADMLRPLQWDFPIPPKEDQIGRHLALLFALHPEKLAEFRQDTTKLTEEEKQELLQTINKQMGIRPLKLK